MIGILNFKLFEEPIECVTSFKYLGILIQNFYSSYNQFISEQLQKAKNRLGVVRLLGFHKDGLRISTAVKLYKLLIRPILEFGAQVVTYSKTQIDQFEKFQTQALRSLMELHQNVKNETVRLISGVEPISARISVLKLRYFHKLRISDDSTILKSIIKSHLENVTIAKLFRLQNGVKLSEEFTSSLKGFAGPIFALLKEFGMLKEFHC